MHAGEPTSASSSNDAARPTGDRAMADRGAQLINQLRIVSRITTAFSSAVGVEDVYSILLSGLLSPLGLGFSHAILFELEPHSDVFAGRFSIGYESADQQREMAGELQAESDFLEKRQSELRQRAESDELAIEELRMLEQGSHWVVNARNQDTQKVDTNAAPPSGKGSDFNLLGYNSFWLDAGNHLARVKGEVRTSWIVDPPSGKLPVRAGANKAFEGFGSFDTYETRPLSERCLLFGRQAGPIMQNAIYNNNFQFVQTPDTVMILVEMVHEPRIIPLFKSKADAKYRPSAIKPWFGDSVGWYEGDTLVVETKNVNPAQVQAMISPTGTLTERFSRWSDEQILYEFTVDDPAYYTQAWKGEMSLNRSAQPLYEYACHEGNYAMPGILRADAEGHDTAIESEGE